MNEEENKFGTGALLDERPQELKDKDYRLEELVASVNPVNWVEKPREQWRKFPIFNQNGSGSCVAQTLAKLLGILYFLKEGVYVHFSATHIYQRRNNKPSAGMAGVNALDIAREGVTLEVLAPSQNMTDEQMDSYVVEPYKQAVGQVFKVPKYVVLPIKDIETVASVIQTTKKGVMTWFFFERPEWTNVPFISKVIDLYAGTTSRHSVAGVDFTLYEGEKAIIIEDSWGEFFGFGGQRVIKESFFKTRNFFAAYPMNFVFEDQTQPSPTPKPKPQYLFTKTLEWSATFFTDPDVKALQDVLKYEGLFPTNVDSTGYYGSVTAKAVLAFQKKHKVASDAELDQLQGRIVGVKTRAKLNELYA